MLGPFADFLPGRATTPAGVQEAAPGPSSLLPSRVPRLPRSSPRVMTDRGGLVRRRLKRYGDAEVRWAISLPILDPNRARRPRTTGMDARSSGVATLTREHPATNARGRPESRVAPHSTIAPASRPRAKYLCSRKKTTRGQAIATKVPALNRSPRVTSDPARLLR